MRPGRIIRPLLISGNTNNKHEAGGAVNADRSRGKAKINGRKSKIS